MTIPKIIHQTWKNDTIPEEWIDYHSTWKKHFPEGEYEHKLWTDKDNENFIKENYKWFYKTFVSYPKGIQRADAIRYFILYHYGGIYADLDCEVRRNFYDDLVPGKINLAGNPYSSNPLHSMNNLMASDKRNNNWKKVFDVLISRKDNFFTLASTGPIVLIDAFKKEGDVHILPYDDFNPMKERKGLRYIETLFLKSYKDRVKSWDTAKVVHHGSESWGKDEVKSFFKHYGILVILLAILIGYVLYRKFYLKEKFIFSKNYI
tara:strand:+ start:1101 stop:1886 length:786 start_codon:yes stop_codon:yes gene_type:complete